MYGALKKFYPCLIQTEPLPKLNTPLRCSARSTGCASVRSSTTPRRTPATIRGGSRMCGVQLQMSVYEPH